LFRLTDCLCKVTLQTITPLFLMENIITLGSFVGWEVNSTSKSVLMFHVFIQ